MNYNLGINKINFGGAFLVNYNSDENKRKEFENENFSNSKGYKMFEDANSGKVFYITSLNRDLLIAKSISDFGLTASYFPNINVGYGKSQDKLTQALTKEITAKHIDDTQEMINFIQLQQNKFKHDRKARIKKKREIIEASKAERAMNRRYKEKDDVALKIKNDFRIFFDVKRINLPNGVVKFVNTDPKQRGQISISPLSKNGFYYVYYQSKDVHEKNLYRKYDREGNFRCSFDGDSKDEYDRFLELYKASIDFNASLKH